MGYTGGQKPSPTYKNILDHTEALIVEFDPLVISYEEMVLEWARRHRPVGHQKRDCQYRSAVWYLNDEQKDVCETVVAGYRAAHSNIVTSVEAATEFYKAEEYHQDYLQKKFCGDGSI